MICRAVGLHLRAYFHGEVLEASVDYAIARAPYPWAGPFAIHRLAPTYGESDFRRQTDFVQTGQRAGLRLD